MAKLLTTLPDNARTIVYQMIVAALKENATLSSVIPAAHWTTYTEADNSVRNTALENAGLPAIRIIPFGAGASPQTQVRQASPLGMAVNLTTKGHDVRDMLNLWGAVEAAIFTGDGVKTLANSIRATLAAEGVARGKNVGSLETINLLAPSIAPSMDSGDSKFMTAEGSILVMMTVPK